MIRTKNNNKFKEGFTVVETLVAISILSLSVVATFTAIQGGIQSSILAKDQITAFYLAGEAVEYIKGIRDDNTLLTLSGTPTPWLTGIPNECFGANACIVDSFIFPKGATGCDGGWGTCPNIKYEISTGKFGYDAGWSNTTFKREIQLEEVVENTEIQVTVRISWVTRGVNKSFQITKSLFTIQ
jgi:type II secretory pathway pseudopilin PulG